MNLEHGGGWRSRAPAWSPTGSRLLLCDDDDDTRRGSWFPRVGSPDAARRRILYYIPEVRPGVGRACDIGPRGHARTSLEEQSAQRADCDDCDWAFYGPIVSRSIPACGDADVFIPRVPRNESGDATRRQPTRAIPEPHGPSRHRGRGGLTHSAVHGGVSRDGVPWSHGPLGPWDHGYTSPVHTTMYRTGRQRRTGRGAGTGRGAQGRPVPLARWSL